MSAAEAGPVVGVVMGSTSDWETMRHAVETLERLGAECDVKVLSAHRTPDALLEWAAGAEDRGLKVIIAGAGGAAHLPGVVASKTLLPVLGVPMESASLKGLDSLLSIVQMPGGVPVGTLGIGKPGAINAGLLAARILARSDAAVAAAVAAFVDEQAAKVLATGDPRTAST
jgi:5-(carboxyamino)imidazole ribonucleotide mutase